MISNYLEDIPNKDFIRGKLVCKPEDDVIG